jgi:HEAT repeat protein
MSDQQADLEQLVLLLGSPSTRGGVPSQLHEAGESVVAPLLAALDHTEADMRQGAAWVMGRLYPSLLASQLAPPAIPALIERLLNDDTATVRQTALNTLVMLTNDADRTVLVEPFIQALADSAEPVRAEAARWLGQMRAQEAVDALSNALQNDESVAVRRRAAYALAYIEPDLKTLQAAGKAGEMALLDAVSDPERSVRLRAIWALGQLKSAAAVKSLVSVLEADQNAIPEKRKAAEALGVIGDSGALEALVTAVQFADEPGVRSSAAEALGQLGNGHRTQDILMRVLRQDLQGEVRASAALALEQLAASDATPALIDALEDSETDVRLRAARALAVVGDDSAIEPLQALLADKQISKPLRLVVEQALARLGGAGEDA